MPTNQEPTPNHTWQFFIDRGGTFTDIVGIRDDGLKQVKKLLSVNPRMYPDAAVQGMREMLGLDADEKLPGKRITEVRLGTTVATNALLERKGQPTLLVVNMGFRDALRIAYQNRPDIFARNIILPQPLYSKVVEVRGRFSARGEEIEPFDENLAYALFKKSFEEGFTSCAIALMHSYLYPEHEESCAKVARKAGFKNVTVSHNTSPLIKLVARGDTTVADAYLSPILHDYIDRFTEPLESTPVYFMQSNGGLTDRNHFRGKDSLLSGPAGGFVGAVETARALGFTNIVGFDMGGTSTDVSHFDGQYERQELTTISGIRIRAPMIPIHTIAAGGGSILHFDGHRLLVGPESAGSAPGPTSYRNDGPLTVTDANLLLNRIQADYFPSVFGAEGDQSLDLDAVAIKFLDLKSQVCRVADFERTEDIAWGFIEIAVEKMARAIKKITIERGCDLKNAVLNAFGGAGGQHACLIAENLGIETVMIHKMAGVLSALGIGLSSIKVVLHRAVQQGMEEVGLEELCEIFEELANGANQRLTLQGAQSQSRQFKKEVQIRYEGSDTTLAVPLSEKGEMIKEFNDLHLQRFGFHSKERRLIVESLALEATAPSQVAYRNNKSGRTQEAMKGTERAPTRPIDTVKFFSHRKWWLSTPIYRRDDLHCGELIAGPAIILDETSTNLVEPGWSAQLREDESLIMTRTAPGEYPGKTAANLDKPDPILLELFNNKFMAIAEEMGVTLSHTSQSVNIKERLDFSCALFDSTGKLIANAPHMPVHLGSMGESVRSVIENFGSSMKPGDVYVLNDPYEGGTHLPDITVVTPVYQNGNGPLFYTASRGHHADVGGITAGSMPPGSKRIEEEGALIPPTLMVRDGIFNETLLRSLFGDCAHPSRNIEQNLSDLKAQIAANNRGVLSLNDLIESYGIDTVYAYMRFVRKNAEDCVREAIDKLSNGQFTVTMDGGAQICVKIAVNKETHSAEIDFAGTSLQQSSNLNAPRAITIAAVLYAFRTLVESNIPLNDGCLAPLTIKVPEGSMLSPVYPAAVVAGNVETSQAIVDAVYGAMNVMAASQGTMNNFTFGNDRYQYYETICGGAGAGPDHAGCSAVQTHMTNSRLTDPEVLEWRFPVILKEFSIRQGSGGIGYYNGGDGTIRKVQFLEPMEASILSERRRVEPFGMAGGGNGSVGRNYVVRKDGTLENLSGTSTTKMQPGDVFVVETPGGGSWGEKQ